MIANKPKISQEDYRFLQTIKEKLHEGDMYSYAQLTNILGIPKKSGKSKILQMNNFFRFFNYIKDEFRPSYIITDIYDEPLPKVRSLRKDAIYTKYIEALLLNILNEDEGNRVIMSKKQWWLKFHMISMEYVKYSEEDEDGVNNLIQDMDSVETMDSPNIKEFYSHINMRFSTIFERVLNSLRLRGLIDYRYIYMVRTNESGRIMYHPANDKEIAIILDAIKLALDTVKLTSYNQLYVYPEKKSKFFNVVNTYERENGLLNVYRELQISHGDLFLHREFNYTIQELNNILVECNNVFVKHVQNEIINKYNKYHYSNIVVNEDNKDILELVTGTTIDDDTILIPKKNKNSNNIKEWIAIKNYVKNQMALVDKLIKV